MFQAGCSDPIEFVALKSLGRLNESTGSQTFKRLLHFVLAHSCRKLYLCGIRCIFCWDCRQHTLWLWRKNDPEFAAAWDEATSEGVDRVEDEAHRRAVEGYNPRPVYHKGEKVGEIREYSDSLLALLLKSRRPEVYARNADMPSKVDVKVLSVEEARNRLLALGLSVPFLEGDYEEVDDA
jgi:hypothetical protein